MYSSISRPLPSTPRTRGASKPAFSRNRSSAWTAGVHGPARRGPVSRRRAASCMPPPMKGTSFTATTSGELDVVERLRGVEVPRRSGVLRPPSHALGEALPPADLALVRLERRDLPVDRTTDVEPDVRVPRPEEEHARHAMMLQPTGELLGEEEVVARRDDTVEPAPAGHAVVGVHLVMAPRIIREDDLGLVLANDPAYLAAKIHADLELAILVTQEDELLHTDRLAGRALLTLSRFGHLLRRSLRIVRALLSARDDAVRHVRAGCLDPRRQGARAAEVHVVGVCEDRHRALRDRKRVGQLHLHLPLVEHPIV